MTFTRSSVMASAFLGKIKQGGGTLSAFKATNKEHTLHSECGQINVINSLVLIDEHVFSAIHRTCAPLG